MLCCKIQSPSIKISIQNISWTERRRWLNSVHAADAGQKLLYLAFIPDLLWLYFITHLLSGTEPLCEMKTL